MFSLCAGHSEALTGILLELQRMEPSAELLKYILSRDVKENDFFAVSILNFWIRNHEKKCAEVISTALTKNASPGKRKRQNSSKAQLSPVSELILAHLNQLRERTRVRAACESHRSILCFSCSNSFTILVSVFNQESVQAALISVQSACTEAQKSRFV